MKIISIKEHPEYLQQGLSYIQNIWATERTMLLYEDCLSHMMKTENVLPQWFLLMDHETIIGCAGLITNDFISRMDLYPWLCALYVDEGHRKKGLSRMLIEAVEAKAKTSFDFLYLCTDHEGYYERFGYECIGIGWHPWGERSSIYQKRIR